MPLLPYRGQLPRLAEDVFVAPDAYLIGDVEAEPGANVWFSCVLRGDVGPIRLGRGANVQDHSILHSNADQPTILGDFTVLGHRAVVHAAVLEDHVMVAIGASVLSGARVGSGSIVAAHAVVTEGSQIPPRSLVIGVPGKVVRTLSDQDYERIVRTQERYAALAREYREALGRGW